MTSVGAGCGPVLTGTTEPNGGTQRVTFEVTNCAPRAVVFLMLGTQDINIGIPGATGCALLTDLIFSQHHLTDTAGVYTWSRALPSDPTGPTIRVQFMEVTFDPALVIRTSNAVTMACP